MRRYAELLAGPGVERGLLGPREVDRLWHRHLLNCAVVAPALAQDARVVDVGSGAGLPGVVWSLLRRDLEVVLVEPLLRRCNFLEEAVATLGLRNVTVVRARAEQLHGHVQADVVTARAVAPLPRLARYCLPLVAPGGQLLALKGESALAELRDADPQLRRMGATSATVSTYGVGIVNPPTTVVAVRAGSGADRPDRRG